ncbi:hypothetical protein HPB49_026302 [Dermacentor silvarum]|nr:hypothetical protein HPB49_026302 [Dermacentor silvarum]
MFICDADLRIVTVDPMRPGLDHDSFLWRTRWLRQRFYVGRIANPSDSGYASLPGATHWSRGSWPQFPAILLRKRLRRSTTAHAAMRCVVARCIGLLMDCFRCQQRYHTLLCEPEGAANIVAACPVLHNLRLSEGNVEDDDESDDNSSSSNTASLIVTATPYHTVRPETGDLD